jgi:MFS family permease
MELAQIVKFKSWDIMKKFFTFNFLIGFGAGFFIPFLPLYMTLRYSVSDTLVGNALALSNAVIAIAFLISPQLVTKIGTVKSIVLTQGLSIIPLLMIPHLGQFDYFIVTYSLRAVLMNMASPITVSYMMSVVDENERASISGITATAWTGGNAISAIIAGFIMDVSLDLPIYLCSLFYCLSTVLFYFSFRSKNSKVKS